MAHDPRIKAAAIFDLIEGLPQRDVAKKYKVSNGTIAAWARDIELSKTEQNRAKPSRSETPREAILKEELERLMVAMAAAPRSILERIANGEIENIPAERAEAVAALLTVASDTGTRLLQAAAIILDRRATDPELPRVVQD